MEFPLPTDCTSILQGGVETWGLVGAKKSPIPGPRS
jgi:hypothetical protein